jgi:retron-type reverse transcriptase
MRSAETILGIIRDRGTRALSLEDVPTTLYPELYLRAYGKISANKGALTCGVTRETADGMTLNKIQHIIKLLRSERYHWTPVRRVYIAKKQSKQKCAL